ncbi:MAG: hypothetical protein IT416_01770 [Candidatus Pacebacteria bacterium]|nr:hypothetical protein [Candidatus Paceibacterota bacterium]
MIHSFSYAKKKIGEVGKIIKTSRSLVIVSDLNKAVIGEGVSFACGGHGMVSRLGKNSVEIMSFTNEVIPVGTEVARTGEVLKITVGDGMLGDTFDALGYLDGGEKDPSKKTSNMPVEFTALGINYRREITEFFVTGVMAVDLLMPLGSGQRELVLGDHKTGKTHFVLQIVKTQARMGKICILGLIGKENTEIKKIEEELEKAGVRNQCIIIAEPAKSSAARLTLVPFTAMTVAEYWRNQGQDTLVVLDDLSHHAVRYREMRLLGDDFPGRDSYPNDIFYLHSRLLERAGNFYLNGKEASITCLPIVNTVDGDISGYIETNVMSMTDGHLFFDKELFFDGIRPAVNPFLSVTRVGRQTQSNLAREVTQKILNIMSNYEDLKRFLRFGAELSGEVRNEINLAHGLKKLLKQNGNVSIFPEVQLWLIGYLWNGFYNGQKAENLADKLQTNKKILIEVIEVVNKAEKFEDLVAGVKDSKQALVLLGEVKK